MTSIAPHANVEAGLARLAGGGLVSVVLVVEDALRPPTHALRAFDFARPFKTHHLHDRTLGPFAYGKHHRYEIKRARGQVDAKEIALADHLGDWQRLYGKLHERHELTGVHAFPDAHFRLLSDLSGVRMFGAFAEGELVSAHLFVTHGNHAISHLAASTARGYKLGAAYAVNDAALGDLDDCDVINFGGGAGSGDDTSGGLARFKAGFSNRTAQSLLCGKVLDRAAYDKLSADAAASDFFPAYRSPKMPEHSGAEH
ncbi:GNAT family N-acetyltransferase [Tardiphaga sp. OK245]|uniref:GNAT family N-acetyltransferase n=1 Tax=Tardiphaga sp. OK245 TaxID=1855306 RepID=UPI00147BEA42|nr:GNAT family N-acetyltransferase [Tardiphaga sp. OK245]